MRRTMWFMFALTGLLAWFLLVFNAWLFCFGGWADFAQLWFGSWEETHFGVTFLQKLMPPFLPMIYIPVFLFINTLNLRKILLGDEIPKNNHVVTINIFTVAACWLLGWTYMLLSIYPIAILALTAKWYSGIEKQQIHVPDPSSALKTVRLVMLITFFSALIFLGYGWHCGRSIATQDTIISSQFNIKAENLFVFPASKFAFGQNVLINSGNKPDGLELGAFLLRPSFGGWSNGKFKIDKFRAEFGPYRIEAPEVRSEVNIADGNFIIKNLMSINIDFSHQGGISFTVGQLNAGLLRSNHLNDLLKGKIYKKISANLLETDFSLQFIKFAKINLNDADGEKIAFLDKGSFSIKRYSSLTDLTLSMSVASNLQKEINSDIIGIGVQKRNQFSGLNNCGFSPLNCGYDFYLEMSDTFPSKFYLKLYQNQSFGLGLRSKAPNDGNFFKYLSSLEVQEIISDPLHCFSKSCFEDRLIIELQYGQKFVDKYRDDTIWLHNKVADKNSNRIPLNWALMTALLAWCRDQGVQPSFNSSFIVNFPQKIVSPFTPEFVEALNHDEMEIEYTNSIVDYKQLL